MKSGKLLMVMACGAAILMGTTAQASLTLDLRLAGDASSQVLKPTDVGASITMYVWAKVVGANDTLAEGLMFAQYGVRSVTTSGGAANGALTGLAFQSPFNVAGTTAGASTELSTVADTIMDIGALKTGSSTIKFRSTARVNANTGTGRALDPLIPLAGWEWNVMTVNFRFDSAVLAGMTSGGSTGFEVQIPTYLAPNTSTNYWEDAATTVKGLPALSGSTVTFTLEQTEATANAGGAYAVHYGTNGSQGNPLNGSGQVTKGFGTVSTKKWDLDGDGIFETTQSNGSIDVTYNQLKGLGYQYNTAKAATFQYTTNDGKTATDVAMVTIMPDTVVAAEAGGPYTVDFGADGNQVYQLNGSGMVISGDGVVLSKMWDLDGNGIFETTQTGGYLEVTYNILKAMGYVDNVAKEATFRAATDTNVSSTGSGAITLLPEPATMALLGLGGLALAIRRRRAA